MLVLVAGSLASYASASEPEHTDVMLLFDTTESMKHALREASAEIEDVITNLDSQVPDVQFGLSEVRDTGGSAYDLNHPEDVPWRLDLPIASSKEAVVNSIRGLSAFGGGDPPEAYARAIWEAVNNPTVGWRPHAAHLVVLVADSIPHDNDLNEGIPESDWLEPSPWDTGTESPELDGVVGTTVNAGTNLDWQAVLQQVAAAGSQLEVIAYHGENGTLAYWENWAARTGGEAVLGGHRELGSKLIRLIQTGAARACNPVHGNTARMLLASLRCAGALAPLATACNATVSIARPLRRLSARKVVKGLSSLARLLNAVRIANFLHRAPHGFSNSAQVVRRLEQPRTAIKLIQLLPHFSKAVRRRDFQRIAVAITEVGGAKACAAGLLSAVT
jgi:hypothetical protein